MSDLVSTATKEEREFDAEVRRRLAARGATDIDVHIGSDIIEVSCKHSGHEYNLGRPRGMGNESEVFALLLRAADMTSFCGHQRQTWADLGITKKGEPDRLFPCAVRDCLDGTPLDAAHLSADYDSEAKVFAIRNGEGTAWIPCQQ